MDERWLPVPGYEGVYEVSDMGRVRSVDRWIPHPRGGVHYRKGVLLRPAADRAGYQHLFLHSAGHGRRWLVHRLVLLAFRGPAPDGHEGNHINGKRADNRLVNLEWVTRSQNHIHAFRVLGRKPPMGALGRTGAKHPMSTPVVGVGPGGEVRFDALMDAKRAGFSAAAISMCLSGKRKSHAGYVWRNP